MIIMEPKSAQHEIDCLWKWYETEKCKIMTEEYDKDIDEYYPFHEHIYYENYADHWRIEELLNKVHVMEDKIYEKYETQGSKG